MNGSALGILIMYSKVGRRLSVMNSFFFSTLGDAVAGQQHDSLGIADPYPKRVRLQKVADMFVAEKLVNKMKESFFFFFFLKKQEQQK